MKRVALLIGVSQHEAGENQSNSLPPLPTAKQDVEAIAQVLQDPELGGFDSADVQQSIDPDLQGIRFGIEALLRDRTPEDLVLLYFSGHAIADESGSLYFATRNTDLANLETTAVAADFLQALMYTSVAQQQIVILDCYFSGGTGFVDVKQQLGGYGKAVLTASTLFQPRNRLGDRIAHPNPAVNCLDYSAKQHGLGLSTYTSYLVEGIQTGAADRDKTGMITIQQLHDYASRKVLIAAPAMQPAIYALPKIGAIAIAKTPPESPQLLYRQAIENFVARSGGHISLLSLRTLDIRRESLAVDRAESLQIQESVLRPYREYKTKLQIYKQVVRAVMQLEELPLSEETQQDLQHLHQDILGLSDRDVAPIEEPLYPSELEKSFPMLMMAWLGISIALLVGIYYLYKNLISPEPSSPIWSGLQIEPAVPEASPSPTPTPISTAKPAVKPKRRPLPPHPPVAKFRIPTEEPMTLTGYEGPVQGLAISPDGKLLIGGSWDNTIKIWDLELAEAIATLSEERTSQVREVAIDPYGERFASASQDGSIEIWKLDRNSEEVATLERTLNAHNRAVYAIAIAPDGLTLVSGSADNTIKIWALETGDLINTLTPRQGDIRAIAITPDGQTIVSGGTDSTIKLWDLETGELQNTLEGHTALVRALAISPDGKTLVSASWDTTLKIWDLETGELQNTLEGHTDSLTSVAISPDGTAIVSGSDDNTIKIWNLQTGEELATLTDHVSDVFSLVFSLDGKTLASASWDRTIKIWR